MSTKIDRERPDTEDAALLIQELEAVLSPMYPDESRHGYSIDKLIEQKVEFFVLRHNDKPAGCAGVQFMTDEDDPDRKNTIFGEVKRMYVRTEFRGHGFAKMLLKHLEEIAVARDVQILRLETGIHQHEAVWLYERCGFYPIAPFADYREDPLSLFLEKRITLSSDRREASEGRTALLLIDVQKGLDDPSLGTRNKPDAESNMALLLAKWRKEERPIIHIRHCSVEPNSPLRPELPGNAFKEEVQPLLGEKQFRKMANSAFVGTKLEQYLHEQGISSLVIVGLTTDHCVSASTRSASDLGFDVTLVSDATAAFERVGYDGVHYSADDIHNVNLVSLDGEFCAVRSTEELCEG